jgi:hypothetical protein
MLSVAQEEKMGRRSESTFRTFWILALGLLTLAPVFYAGPVDGQDIQIPMDERGEVTKIDEGLERRLGLFPEYKDFLEARLYRDSEGEYWLEVYYRAEGEIRRDRKSILPGEVEEFRRKVSRRMREVPPERPVDVSGRSQFLRGTMVVSTGFYGWAVPMALGVGDSKLAVALYMLTAGAGYFLPFQLTENMEVTEAASALSFYGATRGIVHGISLDLLLLGENATARGMVALGLVGSVAEAIAGFAAADALSISAGSASVLGTCGDFGLGYGLGTAHLLGQLEDSSGRAAGGSMLAGSCAGLLGGMVFANQQHFTKGDASVFTTSGLLGAYVPLSIVDISGADDAKVYTASAMAGAAVGLGLGTHLVRGRDFTAGEGTIINLGTTAGGLVGAGLAYLFSSESEDSRKLYLALSSLGALGGFWTTYRSFSADARERASSSSFDIDFCPYGLLQLACPGVGGPGGEVPLAVFEIRF